MIQLLVAVARVHPIRTDRAPDTDGRLDDAAWTTAEPSSTRASPRVTRRPCACCTTTTRSTSGSTAPRPARRSWPGSRGATATSTPTASRSTSRPAATASRPSLRRQGRLPGGLDKVSLELTRRRHHFVGLRWAQHHEPAEDRPDLQPRRPRGTGQTRIRARGGSPTLAGDDAREQERSNRRRSSLPADTTDYMKFSCRR
jgi:hypothetical protein